MDYSILKEQILDDIKTNPIARANSTALNYMIQNNTANYQAVADYSKVLGDVISESINKNIPDGVPDNELGAFADECLVPVYNQSQGTMLSACKSVQRIYNKQANIGLNPADVPKDTNRTDNIANRFKEAINYDEVKFLTNENVARSITRGAVNDSIRTNSKMQSDAGLKVRISRTDGTGCCDWCAGLVGDYDSFDKLPSDFWKVHRNCNCIIDYNVGKTNVRIRYIDGKGSELNKVTEEIISYDKKGNIDKSSIVLSHFDVKTTEEAEKYAKNVLGMDADYSKFDINVANMVNKELTDIVNTFGDVVGSKYLVNVQTYPKKAKFYAAYNNIYREIYMKNVGSKNAMSKMKKDAEEQFAMGFWSTDKAEHSIRHEAGHAIENWLVSTSPSKITKLNQIREDISNKCGIIKWTMEDDVDRKVVKEAGKYLSYYGMRNNKELVAESVAEYLAGNPRETARKVVEIVLEGKI